MPSQFILHDCRVPDVPPEENSRQIRKPTVEEMKESPPQIVTIREAAQMLAEHESTTHKRWRSRGWDIVAYRASQAFFLRDQVERFVKAHRLGRGKGAFIVAHEGMSIIEAAEYLGVRATTLGRQYRKWGIPYYRTRPSEADTRARVFFRKDEIDEWKHSFQARRILSKARLRLLQEKGYGAPPKK